MVHTCRSALASLLACLVLAGCAPGTYDVIARFDPDGAIDLSLNELGFVERATPAGSAANGMRGVGVDDEGRIVGAGVFANDFSGFMFLGSGVSSPGFGTDAVAPAGAAGAPVAVRGIAVDPSSIRSGTRFAAVGTLGSLGDSRMTVVSFDLTGINRSFGTAGRVTVLFPGQPASFGRAVIIQRNRRIVAAGGPALLALTRLLPSGDLDRTFGTDGFVDVPYRDGIGGAQVDDMVSDSRGRIVVVGNSAYGFILARFSEDGVLDASFGDRGLSGIEYRTWLPHARIEAIALDSDQRIYVAGTTSSSPVVGGQLFLCRLTPLGLLDRSFNGTGVVVTDIPDSRSEGFREVLVDGSGRIYGVGNRHVTRSSGRPAETRMLIARYRSDGSIDDTFGTEGFVLYGLMDLGFSATLDRSGRLVIGGIRTQIRE